MRLHFWAKLKDDGDFKRVEQHHGMPMKGRVLTIAFSVYERDGFGIG